VVRKGEGKIDDGWIHGYRCDVMDFERLDVT
jgi:hypothetical protein